MADNYLGNKMEEYYSKKNAQSNSGRGGSFANLSKLLLKTKSFCGFNSNYLITIEQLTKIIGANTLTTSVRGSQTLRFRPICQDEAEKVRASLTDKETAANAFIIICSTEKEDKWVDIDLGISTQSMLLKAAEMGLNAACINAFDKDKITHEFALPMEPLLIVAIGKAKQDENSGTHSHSGLYEVTKDDLIIK